MHFPPKIIFSILVCLVFLSLGNPFHDRQQKISAHPPAIRLDHLTSTIFALAQKSLFDSKNQKDMEFLLSQEILEAGLQVALRILRNRADAEDAVQEAYAKVFSRLKDPHPPHFEDIPMFKGYVIMAVQRVCLNILRVKKRMVLSPSLSLENEETPEGLIFDKTPENELLDKEVFLVMNLAIQLAGETFGGVLAGDFLEMHYKEIAAMNGIPEGTVMSRLHRGRRILQKLAGENLVLQDYLTGHSA